MKAAILLYVAQAMVVAGAVMAERRVQESGLMVSAKTALLSKLQHVDGLEGLLILLAEWGGFCFLALAGILFYSVALKCSSDKKLAKQGIALGVALCLASIFWPLVL